MDSSPLEALIIFFVFIFINAIMYGFGEALKNINRNDLERKADEGVKKAESLLKLAEKPDKFVNTIQVMATTVALFVGFVQMKVYGAVIQDWFLEKLGTYLRYEVLNVLSYVVLAIYLGVLLLSVGVIVPKKLGAKYNEAWAYGLYGIVRFFMIILTPFTAVISWFGNVIVRIFGIDPNETYENVTEEEIMSMVNEGHEQGVLEEREAEMISNIIELDDKQAGDIMTHRNSIVYVNGEMSVKDALDFMIGEKYSRFPVVEDEDVDNIIGIVHIRDVIMEYHHGSESDKKVKEIDGLRKPDFIPETRNIDDIFREMQSEKNHMEIVVDEYGQTAGLLTMEDILEEIVGNIMDEYDEEEHNIIPEGENTYLVKGMTTLEELEETLGIKFDEEDYDTLNGFLISKLDRIPDEDDKPRIQINNVDYSILSVEKNRIASVRIILPETTDEAEE